MKLSAAFLAGLGHADPVQFLDFWKESDVFAVQIDNAIAELKQGRVFYRKYKNLKTVLQYYQNKGICEGGHSDPSYEVVNMKSFDEKLNQAANIENLLGMMEDWIESYACFDLKRQPRGYERIINRMREIGNNDNFRAEEYSFEVSDEKMSYSDALGYCLLKDMWLADFDVEDPNAVRQMVSENILKMLTVFHSR